MLDDQSIYSLKSNHFHDINKHEIGIIIKIANKNVSLSLAAFQSIADNVLGNDFKYYFHKKEMKQAKLILADIEPIHQGHKRGTITNKNFFVICPIRTLSWTHRSSRSPRRISYDA